MTVGRKVETRGGGASLVNRVLRKCLLVMRQKLTINKKMLSVVSAGATAGMERLRTSGGGGGGGGRSVREMAAARDRQARLHSVRTDVAVDLPPRIALPDGEDHHYAASQARMLRLRDHEQESEIYQKCIRPPPNRTVLESESPPPYRSSSAGVLPSSSYSSSSSSGSDWSSGSAPLVVRCHSMSSTSAKPGQKTDFLQRTVKIFTGGKRGAAPAPQATRGRPPPAV